MTKILLACALVIHAVVSSAAENKNPFQKHNIELNFTPDLDYYMFVNHTAASKNSHQVQHDNFFPFIGFNLGVDYTYHPTKMWAVSMGINNQLY